MTAAGRGASRRAAVTSLDRERVLDLFDTQMRRGLVSEPGLRVEHAGRVVRVTGGWNCVLHADIDADTADRVIGLQQAYFEELGSHLEWKVYGHDRPHDLAARLARAGFEPEPPETLMVFDLAGDLPAPSLPPQISLRRIANAAGLPHVNAVSELAFGIDFSAMNAEFAKRLPLGTLCFYVAFDRRDPVGAGRLELPPHGEFAGLYGGCTVPAFRHRGVYRGLVAARAEEARRNGYRYLSVEAEPSSRPILERLGFAPLTTVRGWVWRPRSDRMDGLREEAEEEPEHDRRDE